MTRFEKCWSGSGRLREPGLRVPDDSGNSEFEVPGVARNSSSPEFRELRVPRATSRTRNSGKLREPGVSGDSRYPEIRANPGTRSYGLILEHGVPDDSGKPEPG